MRVTRLGTATVWVACALTTMRLGKSQEAAPAFTTLYSFNGEIGSKDGADPETPLVFGRGGAIYGTTFKGGAPNAGTAFSLTPPATPGGSWTEKIIYTFGPTRAGGISPFSGLVVGMGGALYGVTLSGGATGAAGTVYSLTPPVAAGGTWTETVLYSFPFGVHGRQGYNPEGNLVVGPDGTLYGENSAGGPATVGTVFSLSPPAVAGGLWTESTLYAFGAFSGDGEFPRGGLAMDSAGVLYGVTAAGGSAGYGTVFSLTPPAAPGRGWTETVLHNFAGSPDGALPNSALAAGEGGVYYGTTGSGGIAANTGLGVVFAMTPPAVAGGAWTESVLYSFQGAGDGSGPTGVLFNAKTGKLYGAAITGGAHADGVIFELTPAAGGAVDGTRPAQFRLQ
jgi:uncharacterized repeat protein (TIGR03803 family)